MNAIQQNLIRATSNFHVAENSIHFCAYHEVPSHVARSACDQYYRTWENLQRAITATETFLYFMNASSFINSKMEK